MEFKATQNTYIDQINSAIDQYLPSPNTHPTTLHQAMLYAIKAGGKRLRPTLLLAAFDLLKPQNVDPLPAAVAIECIHSYSLIHDDLPCMDDSPLRRGQPATHIQFDEATALLAGDALLTYAFELTSKYYPDFPQLTQTLATASGSRRLIGGQVDDLSYSPESPDPERALVQIYANKTAALLSASFQMGLILTQAPQATIDTARDIGYHLGLAYQIIDDILDETSSEGALGKPVAQAVQNATLTYPKIHGLEAAKVQAKFHTDEALKLLSGLGYDSTFLEELVKSLVDRVY